MASAGAGTALVMDDTDAGGVKFRAYTSLLPDRNADVAAAKMKALATLVRGNHFRVVDESGVDVTPLDVAAVVTPKFHGSNFQIHYAIETGIRFGRRNDFLGAAEEHLGGVAKAQALGLPGKLMHMFGALTATRPCLKSVALFMEVYGGQYTHPDVAAVPRLKPVQKGIWYAPDIQLVAFDVQVVYGHGVKYLDFADAKALCDEHGIPFVPAAYEGSVDAACAWAAEHCRDNALAHYNPLGLPLLPSNPGEGFVVRLARETSVGAERALTKMKNPDFAEVAHGKEPGAAAKAVADTPAAGVARKYLLPARAAAVTSKLAESFVSMRNLKALAEALARDALADMEEADRAVATEGARVFLTHAVAVMKTHLMSI